MDFTGRKRLEYALNFKEADRVPIEFRIPENLKNYPKAKRLVELVDAYCDTFMGIDAIDKGFFGVNAKSSSEEIENDGRYTYIKNTYETEQGEFTQIVQQDLINVQYRHFKKQFFESVEDFERFAACDFPDLAVPEDYGQQLENACGQRHMPIIGLTHPFGMLARNSPPEIFYMWLYTESDLIHRIMEKMYRQTDRLVREISLPVAYYFCALEMAIEPWLGREMFDEYVFQYDVETNKVIHEVGGLVRHHAHGPVFNHLEHWAEMGIDTMEPMEMAPFGDTVLSEAKKLMGKRMSFGGNIPTQRFVDITKDEIERLVCDAVESCAEGGGFILKGASTVCGLNSFKTYEQLDRIIEACEHFVEAGLKYGRY